MQRYAIHFALLSFVSYAICQQATAALTLQLYSADHHERFSATSFIGNGLDLSGISNSQPVNRTFNIWATMISPSFFLTATHNAPDIGHTHTFYETNSLAGPSVTRTVASGQAIAGTDLWLGRFNQMVPSNIATYAIAIGDLTGTPISVVGASATEAGQRLGRNVIDSQFSNVGVSGDPSVGDVYVFDFDSSGGVGVDEALLVAGDSGAPSFALVGGEIAITGIHWFAGPNSPQFAGTDAALVSGDTRVGRYASQINAAMLGSGEFARFVAVPEPSTLLILGCAGVGLALWRRSREPRNAMNLCQHRCHSSAVKNR